jgi:hypothetical protein
VRSAGAGSPRARPAWRKVKASTARLEIVDEVDIPYPGDYQTICCGSNIRLKVETGMGVHIRREEFTYVCK